MFAHVPHKARFACTGLIVMSAITLTVTILCAIILYGTDSVSPPNPTGQAIVIGLGCYLLLLATGGITAAVLLSKRMPAGRVVAWVVTPFFLINNVIFLVIAIFVIRSLVSDDMRMYLGKEQGDADH